VRIFSAWDTSKFQIKIRTCTKPQRQKNRTLGALHAINTTQIDGKTIENA